MLAIQARASARGRGAQAKLRAARRLEELADHCQRIATQIQQRSCGEPITDRLVSLSDPDARPIRKGKLGTPNEFGYVAQLAEVTATTGRGARGDVLPAASAPGNPGENRLLPQTAAELDRLGLTHARSPSTAGLCPGRPPKPWLDSHPPGSSSPVGPSRAPAAPAGAWPATAPAARAASATSNAGMGCGPAAYEATRASGSGPAGRSWPTTSTPSPSRPPDKTQTDPTGPYRPPPYPAASPLPVNPGEVISGDRLTLAAVTSSRKSTRTATRIDSGPSCMVSSRQRTILQAINRSAAGALWRWSPSQPGASSVEPGHARTRPALARRRLRRRRWVLLYLAPPAAWAAAAASYANLGRHLPPGVAFLLEICAAGIVFGLLFLAAQPGRDPTFSEWRSRVLCARRRAVRVVLLLIAPVWAWLTLWMSTIAGPEVPLIFGALGLPLWLMMAPLLIMLGRFWLRAGTSAAEDAVRWDGRPPVVYLRSFAADHARLSGNLSGYSFEEAIVQRLWLHGPVVAAARPIRTRRGEPQEAMRGGQRMLEYRQGGRVTMWRSLPIAPEGASRSWLTSRDWQRTVLGWL